MSVSPKLITVWCIWWSFQSDAFRCNILIWYCHSVMFISSVTMDGPWRWHKRICKVWV